MGRDRRTATGCDRSPPVAKCSRALENHLARKLYIDPFIMTNRLATIATAQKKTRIRDAIFASFVALGLAISVTSVSTAAAAANPNVTAR